MDPIERVFKEIELNVFETVQDAPFRESVRIFRRVRRMVDNSTEDFYRTLTSRFMDVNKAPQELGVAWPRLTARWRNYKTYVMAGLNRTRSKKAKGQKRQLRRELNSSSSAGSDRFYFGISPMVKSKKRRRPNLKSLIAVLNVEETLGKPQIVMTQSGESNVQLRQGAPNSVPRVVNARGNRFVDTKNLQMEVEIEAYLTPKLKGKRTYSFIEAMALGNENLGEIMGAIEKRRPLFRPYLIWYVDQKAQKIARRVLR
jgi:hypothetical protein